MAILRAGSFDDPGEIYTRLSVNGACSGGGQNLYCTWCSRLRRRVWAVADMTGDGKPEILMLQPDSGTLYWLTSESDYTVALWRELGDSGR